VRNFDWLPFTPLWSPSPILQKISFIESILVSPFGCFFMKKYFLIAKVRKKQSFFSFCTRGTKCNLWVYFTVFKRRNSNIWYATYNNHMEG
jgi:hypothetical protein